MAGWRETKKRITRDGIVRAALGLFARQGYEATPVSQIAEAGRVSPATFFTYFPSKEDVVFADQQDRVRAAADQLRARRPGESPRQLLRRALEQVLAVDPAAGLEEDLQRQRGEVVLASATLRAAAVRRLFESAGAWADALRDAAPELSPIEAHTLVGSALGAAVAAAGHSVDTGEETINATVRDALDRALIDGAR